MSTSDEATAVLEQSRIDVERMSLGVPVLENVTRPDTPTGVLKTRVSVFTRGAGYTDVSRDKAGFAEFFATSWDSCLRAVAASIGNVTLAEDQVAEAFARAWLSWNKVSRHPAPRAWVVRTALNTGASWWRRRRKETPITDYDLEASEDSGNGLDGALLTALRRLPARQREVIVLRVFLDLDIDTTARYLGIAPGTVRAHLSRALTALSGQVPPATITEVYR